MADKKATAVSETKSEARYTKQQLATSSKFTPVERDVLNALLKDDELYTLEQVRTALDAFARKEVR